MVEKEMKDGVTMFYVRLERCNAMKSDDNLSSDWVELYLVDHIFGDDGYCFYLFSGYYGDESHGTVFRKMTESKEESYILFKTFINSYKIYNVLKDYAPEDDQYNIVDFRHYRGFSMLKDEKEMFDSVRDLIRHKSLLIFS